MDEKNIQALTYGPEYMLRRFVNLPDKASDSTPAREFREQFGELFPGLDPTDYWAEVAKFRKAWFAKNNLDREIVSRYIASIFNRKFGPHVKMPHGEFNVMESVLAHDARYHPAVSVDFSTGKTALVPSVTLLDWLADSLLKCRNKLGFCKREGCQTPYFVKMHPRSKYCSESCFRESRLEQKNQWWARNRGKGSNISGRRK